MINPILHHTTVIKNIINLTKMKDSHPVDATASLHASRTLDRTATRPDPWRNLTTNGANDVDEL